MTTSDLLDKKQGPHIHFEAIGKDGREILENSHVRIRPQRLEGDMQRFVAAVQRSDIHPPSRHSWGMPSALGEGGSGAQEFMPWPAMLVIFQRPDGNFLERFGGDGQAVGDTWHLSVEDAEEQARLEYGEVVGRWQSVPIEISDHDVVGFGLRMNSDSN